MVLFASQHVFAQKYSVQLLSLSPVSVLKGVLSREGEILPFQRMVGNQACRCKCEASQGTHMGTTSAAKGLPCSLVLGINHISSGFAALI